MYIYWYDQCVSSLSILFFDAAYNECDYTFCALHNRLICNPGVYITHAAKKLDCATEINAHFLHDVIKTYTVHYFKVLKA